MRNTIFISLLHAFLCAGAAVADELPLRGADETDGPRRDETGEGRVGRRDPEGAADCSAEEKKQKEKEKLINLIAPPLCGTRSPGAFKDKLLSMQSPEELFAVEVWGDRREYYVQDEIFYFLRTNRTAFVTLFWIGPEGSVFIPFTNLKVEANRNHRIDPSNIIVEPIGLERWRVIATLEPHALPCQGTGAEFARAIDKIQRTGLWAAASWDVRSHHGMRGQRRWKSRLRNH